MTTKVQDTVSQHKSTQLNVEVPVINAQLFIFPSGETMGIGSFVDHTNNGYVFIKDAEHLAAAKRFGYIPVSAVLTASGENIQENEYWINTLDPTLGIRQASKEDVATFKTGLKPHCVKVVAMPEDLTAKHYASIISNEQKSLKNGSQVLLECVYDHSLLNEPFVTEKEYRDIFSIKKTSGYVTIHKIAPLSADELGAKIQHLLNELEELEGHADEPYVKKKARQLVDFVKEMVS